MEGWRKKGAGTFYLIIHWLLNITHRPRHTHMGQRTAGLRTALPFPFKWIVSNCIAVSWKGKGSTVKHQTDASFRTENRVRVDIISVFIWKQYPGDKFTNQFINQFMTLSRNVCVLLVFLVTIERCYVSNHNLQVVIVSNHNLQISIKMFTYFCIAAKTAMNDVMGLE